MDAASRLSHFRTILLDRDRFALNGLDLKKRLVEMRELNADRDKRIEALLAMEEQARCIPNCQEAGRALAQVNRAEFTRSQLLNWQKGSPIPQPIN